MRGRRKVYIDEEHLQIAAEKIRALAHPLRMKILEFIDDHGEINVNILYNTLKLEQSITSQHLRILRIQGFLITKRKDKFITYSIDYKELQKCIRVVSRFLDESIH